MAKESLRVVSFNRFKKNISSYLAVGIMCGLFLILVASLNFIDPLVSIVCIPIIVLPVLFASHISCYFLEAKQRITIGAFGRYFVGFFRGQFRGSFRGIVAFFKSLGIYIVALIVAYFVLYYVFANHYGDLFIASFNDLIEVYSASDTTYDDLFNVLYANDGMLLTFINYVASFPIPLTLSSFIYFISVSSISIYYRTNVNGVTGSLIRIGVNKTYSRYGLKIQGDWFKLNWPMIVLSLLGSIGGIILTIFLIKNVEFMFPVSVIGSVILLVFFLPFYFANMEAIYLKYEEGFKRGNNEAIQEVLTRIQTSIDLSEEEKRELESSFNDVNSDEEKK